MSTASNIRNINCLGIEHRVPYSRRFLTRHRLPSTTTVNGNRSEKLYCLTSPLWTRPRKTQTDRNRQTDRQTDRLYANKTPQPAKSLNLEVHMTSKIRNLADILIVRGIILNISVLFFYDPSITVTHNQSSAVQLSWRWHFIWNASKRLVDDADWLLQIGRRPSRCRRTADAVAITRIIELSTPLIGSRHSSRWSGSWAARRRGRASGRGWWRCSWPRTERPSSTCAEARWYIRSGSSRRHTASSTYRQGCRGYGDSHGDSHGYGYGMGMGTVMNPHGSVGNLWGFLNGCNFCGIETNSEFVFS